MARPQKYSEDFIQSVLERRNAGELIEDIASDVGMETKTLTKLINRRYGNIRKDLNLNLAIAEQRKKKYNSKASKKRKETMRTFSLHLNKEVYDAVKSIAELADRKLSVVLRELIETELKRMQEEIIKLKKQEVIID